MWYRRIAKAYLIYVLDRLKARCALNVDMSTILVEKIGRMCHNVAIINWVVCKLDTANQSEHLPGEIVNAPASHDNDDVFGQFAKETIETPGWSWMLWKTTGDEMLHLVMKKAEQTWHISRRQHIITAMSSQTSLTELYAIGSSASCRTEFGIAEHRKWRVDLASKQGWWIWKQSRGIHNQECTHSSHTVSKLWALARHY